jgi:hypothetical protein
VAFARVDDEQPGLARGGEHLATGRHRRAQARHVVAERGAEATGLQEVALHIDDDDSGRLEIDRQRRRLGF